MTEGRTRADRRDAYHRALATIDKQTGYGQPVLIDASSLWMSLVANGSLGHDAAERALTAADENDHIIRWQDAEGQYRYGLTEAGLAELPHADAEQPAYPPEDRGRIRHVLEIETDRPDPDRDVVAWCNQHLQAIDTPADAPADTDADAGGGEDAE